MATAKRNGKILSPSTQAASVLRTAISSGRYKLHEKLPNERALAEQLGVSRGTLRQALGILEGERLIIRQHGRGTFVGNASCSGPSAQRARLIGALAYARPYYFEAVLKGAIDKAAERGYAMTVGDNSTPEQEQHHISAFLNSGVQGFLIAPRDQNSYARWTELCRESVPVVFIDCIPLGYREDYVSVDNARGCYEALEHLHALGHRRVGYLGIGKTLITDQLRAFGFQNGVRDFGMTVAGEWMLDGDEAAALACTRDILQQDDRPTALVCFNDTVALRVVRTAKELGLDVPTDIAVVGFDNSRTAEECEVPITSVDVRHREIGERAAEILLDKIEGRSQAGSAAVHLLPKLVVRESTARGMKGEG